MKGRQRERNSLEDLIISSGDSLQGDSPLRTDDVSTVKTWRGESEPAGAERQFLSSELVSCEFLQNENFICDFASLCCVPVFDFQKKGGGE